MVVRVHRGPGALQQRGQVRVERVAPADVVVHVGHLLQGHVVPLSRQGTRHLAIVVRVLLRAPDGDRRPGPGIAYCPSRSVSRTKRDDPRVAGEAALVRVVARA